MSLGSSPRVWGQVEGDICKVTVFRIIPTRMGTRKRGCKDVENTRDHPHAYGDKGVFSRKKLIAIGSSPRVWGQDRLNRFNNFFHGIIPTRMGTRHLFGVLAVAHRDHPHAYGDKSYNYAPYPHIQGSSPRVWGQAPTRL